MLLGFISQIYQKNQSVKSNRSLMKMIYIFHDQLAKPVTYKENVPLFFNLTKDRDQEHGLQQPL